MIRASLAPLSRRLAPPGRGSRRLDTVSSRRRGVSSSSVKSPKGETNPSKGGDDKHLKWTERKEAPKWMQKIAPPKGGTAPPNKKEMALIAVVCAAGYYAWFVDPPKRAAEQERAEE